MGRGAAALGPVMLFDKGRSVTTRQLVSAWQALALEAGLPLDVAGGSRANFAELNRSDVPYDVLAQGTVAINPQVHAFSNSEVVGTLAVQELVARQAAAMGGGWGWHVGPVTLKPRFNAVATDEADLGPAEVDARQSSLWAASWSLGSVAALARGGAATLTYFETHGPRGVMGRINGAASKLPTYPTYEVLGRLARSRGAQLVGLDIDDSARAPAAVALWLRGRLTILIGNLCEEPVTLEIEGGPATLTQWSMDQSTAQDMMDGTAPELMARTLTSSRLRLGAYEVAILESHER